METTDLSVFDFRPQTLEHVSRVCSDSGISLYGNENFAAEFVDAETPGFDAVRESRIERLHNAILARKRLALGHRLKVEALPLLAAAWEEVLRLEV